MRDIILIDYWQAADCRSDHYGMCYKCGKCGRIFKDGVLVNHDEHPDAEE